MTDLTQEQRTMVAQFQMYQQQMQNLLMQKESMKIQEVELQRAIEELSVTKQVSAYKITGSIMVSKPVQELKKELEEAKEDIGVRLKSVEATEARFESKLKELQSKLTEALK
ncbi:prefoldin subunit beta [archaeon]|nr:MAG: prefoldin subunit beta [archaeon]